MYELQPYFKEAKSVREGCNLSYNPIALWTLN